jgi:hypothetical protein
VPALSRARVLGASVADGPTTVGRVRIPAWTGLGQEARQTLNRAQMSRSGEVVARDPVRMSWWPLHEFEAIAVWIREPGGLWSVGATGKLRALRL